MKRGFSLIMAIIFIIVLSIIAMASLRFATASARGTSQIFLREQAELLALNAMEFTIMEMQRTDYQKNCFTNLVLYFPQKNNYTLKATTNVKYFDEQMKTCTGWHNLESNFLEDNGGTFFTKFKQLSWFHNDATKNYTFRDPTPNTNYDIDVTIENLNKNNGSEKGFGADTIALIDVYVEANPDLKEYIRIHKRMVQRP